jgi:hypothetical protein
MDGHYAKGFNKKSGENWSVYSGLPANSVIESLTADAQGNIWAGWYSYDASAVFSGGLAKISSDGSITHYNTSNSSLPGNFINQLAFDKEGNLWASLGNGEGDQLFYRGLCKIELLNDTATQFTSIPAGGNGQSTAYPTDMIVDNNNNVWLSYYGHPASQRQGVVPALSKYNGTTWTHYNYQNSNLPSLTIKALAMDNEGNVYTLNDPVYSSGTGSLVRFNGLNSVLLPVPAAWVGSSYWGTDLKIDKENLIWISSSKGVASYQRSSQTWTLYDAQNSLFPKYYSNAYSHYVGSIVIDSDNTKYFNSANDSPGKDGIVMYNENGFGSNQKQDQTITKFGFDDVTYL